MGAFETSGALRSGRRGVWNVMIRNAKFVLIVE